MTAVPTSIPKPAADRERVPPLENGDHLKADEFRRRYAAMPENVRAELIGGIVFMASPVRHRHHAKPHVVVSSWLGYYLSKTPGLDIYGDNCTVRLEEESEPQPDLMLALPSHLGGRAREDEDDYINGPPDFLCEIASSSASIDLGRKLRDYRSSRVPEYLIWSVNDARILWFDLLDGEYIAKPVDADGRLRSNLFPGLWLDPAKLLALDLPGLFKDLDAGASTPEHAAFIKKLAAGNETA